MPGCGGYFQDARISPAPVVFGLACAGPRGGVGRSPGSPRRPARPGKESRRWLLLFEMSPVLSDRWSLGSGRPRFESEPDTFWQWNPELILSGPQFPCAEKEKASTFQQGDDIEDINKAFDIVSGTEKWLRKQTCSYRCYCLLIFNYRLDPGVRSGPEFGGSRIDSRNQSRKGSQAGQQAHLGPGNRESRAGLCSVFWEYDLLPRLFAHLDDGD